MIVFFTVLANSDCFFFIPFDIMSLFWHFFQVRLFSHFNILLFRLFSLFNLSLISTLSNFNSFFISIFVSYRFFPCNFFSITIVHPIPTFISKNHQYFDPHAHITQKLFHTNSISICVMLFHEAGTHSSSFNHNLFAHPYIYWP